MRACVSPLQTPMGSRLREHSRGRARCSDARAHCCKQERMGASDVSNARWEKATLVSRSLVCCVLARLRCLGALWACKSSPAVFLPASSVESEVEGPSLKASSTANTHALNTTTLLATNCSSRVTTLCCQQKHLAHAERSRASPLFVCAPVVARSSEGLQQHSMALRRAAGSLAQRLAALPAEAGSLAAVHQQQPALLLGCGFLALFSLGVCGVCSTRDRSPPTGVAPRRNDGPSGVRHASSQAGAFGELPNKRARFDQAASALALEPGRVASEREDEDLGPVLALTGCLNVLQPHTCELCREKAMQSTLIAETLSLPLASLSPCTVKLRIRAIKNIGKITKAMKMVRSLAGERGAAREERRKRDDARRRPPPCLHSLRRRRSTRAHPHIPHQKTPLRWRRQRCATRRWRSRTAAASCSRLCACLATSLVSACVV